MRIGVLWFLVAFSGMVRVNLCKVCTQPSACVNRFCMKFDRHRLITRRSRLNFTQEDLAGVAGVAVRSVAGWESGETQPTVKMVQKLSDALQVPAGWLYGENSIIASDPAPRESGSESKQIQGRILRRFSELSTVERMRIEPIILSLIDAIIALRNPHSLSDDDLRAGITAAHKAAGIPSPGFDAEGNAAAGRQK
ncbi:MAG: helix-turn-helix domain-containing protein [Hyphomicrobiaceae bacterium]|nr:MAG: helix-turn-helix domain-containing protein [Hyphomicrobiaceae bacterium]